MPAQQSPVMTFTTQREQDPVTESTLNLPVFAGFRRVPLIRKPVQDPLPEGEAHSSVHEKGFPGKPEFEYAEHANIGDYITITLEDGSSSLAYKKPFTLPNGLKLTFGQIGALAGDFYGTILPICLGTTLAEQVDRFNAAFRELAFPSSRQPAEALSLLKALAAEVAAIKKAVEDKKEPSYVYADLPDITLELERLTLGRSSSFPAYLGLAAINFDHFGEDARTAYQAGHYQAIKSAAQGNLQLAYAQEAFAGHFLEDSFSAGHVRTPRRALHDPVNPAYDLCAKYMHDEDNAIGLKVQSEQNPSGWKMYGDKRLLDKVDKDNYNTVFQIVQIGAQEVYTAYHARQELPIGKYAFRRWVPDIAKTIDGEALSPLFKEVSGQQLNRRKDIKDRRNPTNSYTTDWWAATTAALCASSGWWKFPIVIDGPGHDTEYNQ